jgi:hypothetical protein
MAATREPIYSALAQLVFADKRIDAAQGGVFRTTGRLLKHYQQIPGGPSACPALYLIERPGERHERIGKGISPKRTLECHFVMYFYTPGDESSALPATACNNGLDAIDDVINMNPVTGPANTQTLGGLVEHVYLEGAVGIAEALLPDYSIVEVPITILIP